jgi:hypothetical protein
VIEAFDKMAEQFNAELEEVRADAHWLSEQLDRAVVAMAGVRAALHSMPGVDPFAHGPLAEADSLMETLLETIAKGRQGVETSEGDRE